MPESLPPTAHIAIVAILVLMVLPWLWLSRWIFLRMQIRHPEKYAEMGSPSPMLQSNIRTTSGYLQFLWKSEFMDFDDIPLQRVGKIMRALLIIYSAIFFLGTAFVIYSILFHAPN